MPIFTYPLRPEPASCGYPMNYNPFVEAFLAPALAAAQAAEQQQKQQQKPQQVKEKKPAEQKPSNPSPRPAFVPKPAPTPRYHNRSLRSFEPQFDVYETEQSYVLEGSLPGLADKKNIDIEFSDDRTLLIRGRIERPAPPTSTPVQEEKESDEKSEVAEKKEKRKSLKTTVEDTDDEDDFSIVRTSSSSSLASDAEKVEKKEVVEKQQEEKKQEPATRTLLSERVFGSFQRTFAFPAVVDLEEVKASLEYGVLRIIVPKGFRGVRKIEVV